MGLAPCRWLSPFVCAHLTALLFSNSNPADEEVKQEAAAATQKAAEGEDMLKRTGDEENKGEEGKSLGSHPPALNPARAGSGKPYSASCHAVVKFVLIPGFCQGCAVRGGHRLNERRT